MIFPIIQPLFQLVILLYHKNKTLSLICIGKLKCWFSFTGFIFIKTQKDSGDPSKAFWKLRPSVLLYKSIRLYKNKNILWVKVIQSSTETSRREKSARNTFVSSTREFWNFRFKTKSWNFVDCWNHPLDNFT